MSGEFHFRPVIWNCFPFSLFLVMDGAQLNPGISVSAVLEEDHLLLKKGICKVQCASRICLKKVGGAGVVAQR